MSRPGQLRSGLGRSVRILRWYRRGLSSDSQGGDPSPPPSETSKRTGSKKLFGRLGEGYRIVGPDRMFELRSLGPEFDTDDEAASSLSEELDQFEEESPYRIQIRETLAKIPLGGESVMFSDSLSSEEMSSPARERQRKIALSRFAKIVGEKGGVFAVKKPPDVSPGQLRFLMTSCLYRLPTKVGMRATFQKPFRRKRVSAYVASPLRRTWDGVVVVGVGSLSELATVLADRFPMEFTVEVRLGIETTNYEETGLAIRKAGYEHLDKEKFELELKSAITASEEKIMEELAMDCSSWFIRKSREHYESELAESGQLPDIEKIAEHYNPYKQNMKFHRRFTRPTYPADKSLDPTFGDWTVFRAELVDFKPPSVTVRLGAIGDSWIPMFHLLAKRLGTLACVSRVTRTSHGPFGLEKALSFSQCKNNGEDSYQTFFRAHGNPSRFFEASTSSTILAAAGRNLFLEKVERKMRSKLHRKFGQAKTVRTLREELEPRKLTHYLRKDTQKGKEPGA